MSVEAIGRRFPRQSIPAELRVVGSWLLYVLVPLLLTLAMAEGLYRRGILAFDLDGTILQPADAVARGGNPYPPATPAALDVGNPSLYPPLVFLLAQPLAAVPHGLAVGIWTALLAAAPAGALALLEVRDARAYAAATLFLPLVVGVVFGNLTVLLVVGLALAWRYRDAPLAAGAALGVSIALKLFLWPLLVWLLLTRRFRAAGWGALSAALLVVAPWAAIDFRGLAEYPHLLSTATAVFAPHGVSLYGAAVGAGLDRLTADALVFAVAGALAVVAARTARAEGGDARAFTYAVAAAIVLSPIVWVHYLVLLVPCVAILQPRLGRLWLVLPATWAVFLILPGATGAPCCAPADEPAFVWNGLHGSTPYWQAGATAVLLGVLALGSHGRTARAKRPFGSGSRDLPGLDTAERCTR